MVNGKHADDVLLEKSKNFEEKTAEKEDAKNSCSSCKGNERTSEMAQDNSPCWDSLPSVILLEIFSYLPQSSRLRASQVHDPFLSISLYALVKLRKWYLGSHT